MDESEGRRKLLAWWRSVDAAAPPDLGEAQRRALDALDLGEPLLALDICRRALAATPAAQEQRLRQLEALALARSGAPLAAQRVLDAVIDAGLDAGHGVDSESLGLLARTYKDLAQGAEGAERRRLLAKALDWYERAHFASRRPWTGVNVASLRLALGDEKGAQDAAAEVLASLQSGATEDKAWDQLTRAECHLVCRNPAGAAKFFRSAMLNGAAPGRLASARRNASLASHALGITEGELEDLFPRTQLIVFCGHRIDAAGRTPPRFSPAAEAGVRDAIRAQLAALEVAVGVSSAADGADIVFGEAMLERGGELHLVLPAEPEAFRATSVAESWRARYARLLERAASVTVLAPAAGHSVDFQYGNLGLLAIARLRARHYGCRIAGLAVWDGGEGLQGGTAHGVGLWSQHAIHAIAIDPASLETTILPPAAPLPQPQVDAGHRIVSLVFADAVGFSRLAEEEIAAFAATAMARIGEALDRLGGAVLARNTWGDAVHAAFDRPSDAARFARFVAGACELSRKAGAAIPASLSFRVSVHVGPAKQVWDSVSRTDSYLGRHVNWAARLEPITPAGCVYASEPFAAICALDEQAKGLEFGYAGHVPLAKEFGVLPVYLLEEADA